jgi:hypothetical protein
MLLYPAALPLSPQTLNYTAGIIRRHRRRSDPAGGNSPPVGAGGHVRTPTGAGPSPRRIRTPTAPERSYGPPASAPTPSSRPDASCANSGAAPGAPVFQFGFVT